MRVYKLVDKCELCVFRWLEWICMLCLPAHVCVLGEGIISHAQVSLYVCPPVCFGRKVMSRLLKADATTIGRQDELQIAISCV